MTFFAVFENTLLKLRLFRDTPDLNLLIISNKAVCSIIFNVNFEVIHPENCFFFKVDIFVLMEKSVNFAVGGVKCDQHLSCDKLAKSFATLQNKRACLDDLCRGKSKV